jgi:hypothetical protein
MNRQRILVLALALLICAAAGSASAANLVLVNFDPPGAGLNDPTPAAPVGGNPGVTLGQQRQFAYLYAADLWGSVIDSPADIFVGASFAPLTCSPTSGVLGSAGTTFIFRDFPGSQFAGTWYHSALADALAGGDLNPGFIDINSRFNSRIGTDPGCLVGSDWYYGIDHAAGNDFDFLNVVMHEIAHGLGFANFVNEATGALQSGFVDIYALYTLDTTTGLTWDLMTNAERAASAVNDRNVVWNGPAVAAEAPSVLGARPSVKVLQPKAIKGSYEAQPASFGPPLTGGGGTTGQIVLADDGVDAAADACEPLVNKANGKLVLADRGVCAFTVKVANAQAAGAKGVIIANNVPVGLPGMGGADPAITIPSVGITQADGQAIRDELPHVNAKLILDASQLAGAVDGLPRLYAPPVVALGSSISHWDVSATPNLLMEPFINPDLRAAETLDLTPAQLQDIGWILLP